VDRAYVDLSPVTSRLEMVGQMVSHTAQKVDGVSEQVRDLTEFHLQTQQELQCLMRDFEAYRDESSRRALVADANARLIQLRMEAEKKFARFETARRMATGLVAAMSAGTVPLRVIKDLTAGSMVMEGRFWLPPALQALGEWVANNPPLAEAALREAVQRNDAKTAMFFALVCRRCNRHEATNSWLSRYFLCQHPSLLDRDVVIMLNGMASGVFGASALNSCLSICRDWFKELEQEAGFQQTQIDRWKKAIDGVAPAIEDTAYPTLRQYAASTWPLLEASLSRARRNQIILNYFSMVFQGELAVPPRLTAMVDELLDSLVRDHDPDEIPTEREIKTNEYIVRFRGDLRAVDAELKQHEPAFQSKQDFASLLSNIAMYPETVNASEGAQRYAVALSKQWIIEANSDLSTRDRNLIPQQCELEIGSWKGLATSGEDETALGQLIAKHYETLAEQSAAQVKLSPMAYLAPAIAVFLAYSIGLLSVFSWFLLACGATFFYFQRKSVADQQDRLRQGALAEKEQAIKVLRAAMAEMTDYHREIQVEDAKAETVRRFFEDISPEQYVKQLDNAVRRVIR